MNITFRYSHILFRINSENKRYIAYSQRYGETNKKENVEQFLLFFCIVSLSELGREEKQKKKWPLNMKAELDTRAHAPTAKHTAEVEETAPAILPSSSSSTTLPHPPMYKTWSIIDVLNASHSGSNCSYYTLPLACLPARRTYE